MNKYEVGIHEIALYEIMANDEEEAKNLVFEFSEGDFVGYDDQHESFASVKLIEEDKYEYSF